MDDYLEGIGKWREERDRIGVRNWEDWREGREAMD